MRRNPTAARISRGPPRSPTARSPTNAGCSSASGRTATACSAPYYLRLRRRRPKRRSPGAPRISDSRSARGRCSRSSRAKIGRRAPPSSAGCGARCSRCRRRRRSLKNSNARASTAHHLSPRTSPRRRQSASAVGRGKPMRILPLPRAFWQASKLRERKRRAAETSASNRPRRRNEKFPSRRQKKKKSSRRPTPDRSYRRRFLLLRSQRQSRITIISMCRFRRRRRRCTKTSASQSSASDWTFPACSDCCRPDGRAIPKTSTPSSACRFESWCWT